MLASRCRAGPGSRLPFEFAWCLLGLIARASLQQTESVLGNSGKLDRLGMPPRVPGEAQPPYDELRERAAALSRLQAADDDWWDGIKVDVPWAAVCDSMHKRADTWF